MTCERILFVDDEPNILAGLQRMLRFMRGQWDMQFVDSGRGALDRLAAEPFDAVVTDMRMPGLNGAQLLDRVRQSHPEMVRVVLSGHSEMEDAVVLCGTAHQVLSKPCEPQTLVAAIRRALTLRGLLRQAALEALVASLPTLPAVPPAYVTLLEAKHRPGSTPEELAVGVEIDQPLCAMVRAASFFPDGMAECSHATIRMLSPDALSALLIRSGQESQSTGLAVEVKAAMLAHDLQGARAAHRIAAREGLPLPQQELAVAAALVNSLGLAVIAGQRPDLTEAVRRLVAGGQDPAEAEEAVLGVRHQALSGYLLAMWEVGWPLVEAVSFSGNPSLTGNDRLDPAGIAHLACCLTGPAPVYGPGRAFLPNGSLDRDYLRLLRRENDLGFWMDAARDPAA